MDPNRTWESLREGDIRPLEHGFCDYTEYVFNTTYFDTRSGGTAPAATKLADDECPHGRLAGDRTPPCGCFAIGERVDANPLIAREAA